MENRHALPIGTTLDSGTSKYRVEGVIGSGGFGITYKASATITHGNVPIRATFAIKEHFMKGECERDADNSRVVYSNPARERVENAKRDFIAEAKRLQRVGALHKNIVKVNEVFEDNNTAYYVMEYLDGESLRAYVKRRGKLSEKEAMTITRLIGGAMTCMHRERMTHLDIKPDNVMITNTAEGKKRPVLIDFGLSKHYDKNGSPTSTINTLGCSDGYAPIEQYAGIETFSPEADIYALGATAWFCLTGQDPKKSTELRDGELAEAIAGMVTAETEDFIRQATRQMKTDRSLTLKRPRPQKPTPDDKQTRKIDKSTHGNITLKKRWARLPKLVRYPLSLAIGIALGLAISGIINQLGDPYKGHEYVDLGLPSGIKWATSNIGAASPSDYGDYYSWSETTTKTEYWSVNSGIDLNDASDIAGNTQYDAARANWGGAWEIPNKDDWRELIANCQWTWTTQGGHKGYKVTGPNGNSIFLPAAGFRLELTYYTGKEGFYCSSTPHEENKKNSYRLYFNGSKREVNWGGSSYGRSIRPVAK